MTSPLVTAYLEAEHRLNVCWAASGESVDNEERASYVEAITLAHDDRWHAAEALVRDATPRHRIEGGVKVYLVLTRSGWAIDPVTTDDCELDSTTDYLPHNADCNVGGEGHNDEECEALRRAAVQIGLPNARDLYEMLGLALEGL